LRAPTGEERFRESLVATRELAELFLDLLELLAEPLFGLEARIEQLGAMLAEQRHCDEIPPSADDDP